MCQVLLVWSYWRCWKFVLQPGSNVLRLGVNSKQGCCSACDVCSSVGVSVRLGCGLAPQALLQQ